MQIKTKLAVEQLQFSSEKASDICRNLAFVAFAIAWIFRTQNDTGHTVPVLLIYGSAYSTIVLMLDLFQYVLSTVVLQIALQREGVTDDEQVIKVMKTGIINSTLFYIKIFLIVISYMFILKFFIITLL